VCTANTGEVIVNKVPVVASFICAVSAAIIGYVMIPGESEKIAMLVRDGHAELALQRANELVAGGDREPTLLLQAFMLNERAGEYGRAVEMLDAYMEQRPDDAAAWRKAAEAFDESGQSELLRNALENVVRLTRDPAAAGKLSAIYRLRGDEENELRVLSVPEVAGLADVDAVRFAQLLVARGRTAEAISALEPIDEKSSGLPDEARIQLFTALIDQRDYKEAADRALAWQKDKKGAALQDVFVGYLLRAGADEQALRLATTQSVVTDPKSMTHAAQLFFQEGRYDIVDEVVRGWLAYASKLPAEKLDAYFAEVVNVARASGTGNKLFEELFQTLAQHSSPEVEASFIQAMYDQMGYQGIAPFRYTIGPSVLLARPVFAARLLTVERNALAARRLLMTVDLPSQSASARLEWLALAKQMLSPEEFGSELARRAQAGTIPPEMKRAVLEAALQLRSQPQIMAIWQSFFDTGTPDFSERRIAEVEPLNADAGVGVR
jgi:tetratricopeptide (TPR) repeat protein